MALFYISIAAAAFCLLVFLLQAIYLIKLGKPNDLSEKAGSIKKGVCYSFIGAMSPTQKESAYKHLPTYLAGVLYHIGSFIMLLFYLWVVFTSFVHVAIPIIIYYAAAITIAVSAICGIAILLKRIVNPKLRYLSSTDDYISNMVTTGAQVATVLFICFTVVEQSIPMMAYAYFIVMAIFFLWLPLGKTKHALYFFFARYHLGYFYGWRDCWPIKNNSHEQA